jgi:hypothetical protein
VIKNKGFLWVPFVHLPNWQQYISKVEEKYMFGLLLLSSVFVADGLCSFTELVLTKTLKFSTSEVIMYQSGDAI